MEKSFEFDEVLKKSQEIRDVISQMMAKLQQMSEKLEEL